MTGLPQRIGPEIHRPLGDARQVEPDGHAERLIGEVRIGAGIDREARIRCERERPDDRRVVLAQELDGRGVRRVVRIRQQQIRRKESLRPFSEEPRPRWPANRLLGVRAIAGRIPAHGAFDDQRHEAGRGDDHRHLGVFEAGDVVDANRHARARSQLILVGVDRAVRLQEAELEGRRAERGIGDEQVGVEERAGRAFGEVIFGDERRQHDVVPVPPIYEI